MRFVKYDTAEAFGADTLELLLENEVQNNLLVSFILRDGDKTGWLFATVKDGAGSVVLSAVWTGLPFNIVLYETGNKPNGAALTVLADGLKALGYTFPGVLVEQGLAKRFAETWTDKYHLHMSMNIMRLDAVSDTAKAPGAARLMRADDFFYLPYWLRAFAEECHVEVDDIQTNAERLKAWMKEALFYVWEDGHPVSMVANTRNTQNGAVVNWVYTPPHYRGKGYALSNVAKLSREMLNRGHKFCCLFADAANPTSCGIYRKIGYADLCVFDAIEFGGENA
ncbi:MAG: GNAT family N-acetyltransferase [Oscillospiraceae bacterium]|nr:GNAT family N-acetyltransferase [Oscillospiraceae bacterium]